MKKVVLLLIVSVALVFIYMNITPEPTKLCQKKIQNLSFVPNQNMSGILKDPVYKEYEGLPYPQISRESFRLTEGPVPEPLQRLATKVSDTFMRVRNLDTPSTMSPERMYLPDYYRKDTMGGNDLQSSEMRPVGGDVSGDQDSESAWTDENVSDHPKFYSSTLEGDELTNIGGFFDENHRFSDTTSCNTYALPSDTCYKDKLGKTFCLDKTRLQVVPPALITDLPRNRALGDIGVYKDRSRLSEGGIFFGSVTGTRGIDKKPYAEPLKRKYGSCNV